MFSAFSSKRSRIKDNRDERLVKRQLEKYPEGYPRISAYIDSDSDTPLFRRFGILHARSLLYKQVELTELEAQLDKLDKEDEGEPGADDNKWRLGHSISLAGGKENEKRRDLMKKIDEKLEEYDKLVLREAAMRKLSRPSKRTYLNFMDFMYTEHPFSDSDERFVYHEHDFVSLEEHEENWLDEIMHRFMRHCRKGILRTIFVSPDDQAKTKDPHVHYYSANRLGAFIKVIIAVASTALLLIPIYIFLTCSMSVRLMAAITLLFALLFASAVSVFTSANRQEVFGATAAYCAVLVVFIGNIQQTATLHAG
ncbi:hypothetical protein N431DRAFT_436695 [Stipitochalara longipes BDJ]|nr:hypothetical protein N431DRAFT_436695 [Stipitochalara longipes BDJ]